MTKEPRLTEIRTVQNDVRGNERMLSASRQATKRPKKDFAAENGGPTSSNDIPDRGWRGWLSKGCPPALGSQDLSPCAYLRLEPLDAPMSAKVWDRGWLTKELSTEYHPGAE